ncbi:uncharacterized protein BDR25DRAFT_304033 [Lindgomyces ingoldianus]|uniref:Uncharacterized protein n=1 Tax=Lindgomyces ingoldianus TaxID=673940 RepID=A0ACB6QT85_9PLEO|nr:uncharacterized protein BDR25DRAFT_304033 [Lindgomyces ingoldianus]KAF2470057.1 hypothetical protein BDR25DRAFT_304033 [Lindgomyces ingoldianus]
MADSSPESSQDLSFPPVRVNRSLARLDLDALIMRSNPRLHAEEASGALDDSTYDMLAEDAYETSDDEGHTESLASTDGHTPDDVSSIDDTEEEFDDGDLVDASQQLPNPLAASSNEPFDPQPRTSPDDSVITSKTDTQFGEASHIQIEEHSATGQDSLDGCGILRVFDQALGVDVLQPYDCPDIRFTVRLALSQRFLSISETFRVMYVGDFPDWAKDEITGQIGAALDVSSHSSRFSVVRIHEGASANKVQLVESPNVLLDVVDCTPLKIIERAGKPHSIQLTLKEGKQLVFGPSRAPQLLGESNAFQAPDLVVLCHSALQPEPESDSEIEQTKQIRFARKTFKAHNIPCLDIGMVWPFRNCPKAFAFDGDSLRLCVEGRLGSGHEYQILDTLPIDIYGFLQIEPSQLNRHLAYISGSQGDPYPRSFLANAKGNMAQEHLTKDQSRWSMRNIVPTFAKDAHSANESEWWQKLKLCGTVLALIVMLVVSSIASGFSLISPPNVAQKEVLSTASTSHSLCTSAPATQVSVSSPLVSPIPAATSVIKSISRDLTIVNSEETPSRSQQDRSSSLKEANSQGFQVQVTGDHQFMLTPVGNLVNGRRKPQIQIQVVRHSQIVPVRMTRSNDGSYTVDLEREYPLGSFNVSIVARRKPLLYQDFEIKLGSSKSRISFLIDNINHVCKSLKHDVAMAQHNLKDLSSQVTKGFHEGMDRLEDSAAAAFGQTRHWTHRIQHSTQSAAGHLQGASRVACHHLSAGAKVTKDVATFIRQNLQGSTSRFSGLVQQLPGVRIPTLWETTRRVRTSRNIHKARKNALRLWEKAKKADRKARERSEKEMEKHKRIMDRKGRKLRIKAQKLRDRSRG